MIYDIKHGFLDVSKYVIENEKFIVTKKVSTMNKQIKKKENENDKLHRSIIKLRDY